MASPLKWKRAVSGFSTRLKSFDTAVAQVSDALKTESVGVLTDSVDSGEI